MEKLFKIVKDNKKSLRLKSTEIEKPYDPKYLELGKEMLEYLKLSQDDDFAKKNHLRSGVGLAAPQIGVNKRLIAVYVKFIDSKTKKLIEHEFVLINPKITRSTIQMCALEGGEGCLSVDNPHEGYVYRHYKITIKAFSVLDNNEIEFTVAGYLAIVLQHELDHLDGILFYDRIDKNAPFAKKNGVIII